MMATPPSRSDSSDNILKLENNETNLNAEPHDPFVDFFMSTSPSVDFLRRNFDGALVNATLVAATGFGIGLLEEQGFEGSRLVARSMVQTATCCTVVYRLAKHYLKSLRGKDDVFNAGLAGCCTGLAINLPDTSPIMKCVTVAAVRFIVEGLSSKHPALAHSSSLRSQKSQSDFAGLLPPLALPLPNELKESFSSFCESVRKCNKINVQAGSR